MTSLIALSSIDAVSRIFSLLVATVAIAIAFYFFCDIKLSGIIPRTSSEWYNVLLRLAALTSTILCAAGYTTHSFLPTLLGGLLAIFTLILARFAHDLKQPSFIVYTAWTTLLLSASLIFFYLPTYAL